MFERFTDRARMVVVRAQEEARLLHHHWIGTEHLLLGLVSESEGIGAQVLVDQGIDLSEVRNAVKEIIGQGEVPPGSHLPFTPRSKKVLELSLRESLQLGHNYIGTEHILLALVRETEGVACQVLTARGVDLKALRAAVATKLGVDPKRLENLPRRAERRQPSQCVHPAKDLEVRAAEGYRTVRCRRCGQLVGVLPAP